MLTQEMRRRFLHYFQKEGHRILPSSPVVPHEDPTLLFTNAGMNQFKDVFLGKSVRDYQRAATSQKCLRVGGKHNDLENVGHTSRHLTFFEMLGNFSFGDYFKTEAIRFAWEVTTSVFGFDPERIWVSVFREDDEAFDLWRSYMPAERIVRLDERDNFWAMGDTGPCGPCSELLYDRGESWSSAPSPYEDTEGERYFEFWNLVFMQYNRDGNGKMAPLPKKSIDTGTGIERVVGLKIGAKTVFETDILRGLIDKVAEISDRKYNPQGTLAPAFHVIADHLRALAFSIADGVQPSNADRGYVLRKVLRRAVRYGKHLGFEQPFLGQIYPRLSEVMGDDYPELRASEQRILETLQLEEENFFRTLRRGGNLLNQIMERSQAQKQQISGDDAFKLKDTYGLPLEEILLLAKDAGLTVDLERYQALEQEARERSRSAHKVTQQVVAENVFADYLKENGPCEFTGFHSCEGSGKVKALLVNGALVERLQQGDEGIVVLSRTPFYAEKGGQIGDSGKLTKEETLFEVADCQMPYPNVISHIGKVTHGEIRIGDQLDCHVDHEKRQKIANNHTATHLLHWALQRVLGEHIKQAGSVVAADRLRFDFNHHKPLSKEELRHIEELVNAKVRQNQPVKWYEIDYNEAQKRNDIKQFFGDKYGAKVRVVDIDFSKELCGGTHADHTGTIGLIRILKESSIAAGVRRIEAVSGAEALALSHGTEDLLEEVAALLKTPSQKLLERVSKLLQENTEYAKEMKAAKKTQIRQLIGDLLKKVEKVKDLPCLLAEVDLDIGDLPEMAEGIMEKWKSGVLLLIAKGEGKCSALARVSQEWVGKGIKASDIIKKIAPIIGGGGGGKADSAQAGGKMPEKIPEALKSARDFLEELC